MLLKNYCFLHKRAFFSLFYRWLFVYFDYFIFLTLYRVFTPTIDKLKTLSLQHKNFSSFFSAKN